MRDRFAAREELHCYLAAAQLIARHISSPREVQILSLMERQLLDYAGSTQYGLIAFEGQREFLASVGFINNDQGRGKFAVVDVSSKVDPSQHPILVDDIPLPSICVSMIPVCAKAALRRQRAFGTGCLADDGRFGSQGRKRSARSTCTVPAHMHACHTRSGKQCCRSSAQSLCSTPGQPRSGKPKS